MISFFAYLRYFIATLSQLRSVSSSSIYIAVLFKIYDDSVIEMVGERKEGERVNA